MPLVTFTERRGLSAADKARLSAAMLEAQVAAGFDRDDPFHRFGAPTVALSTVVAGEQH
jgi:hypothetical protein